MDNPRLQGAMMAVGGLSEAGVGAAMTYGTGGTAALFGAGFLVAHGTDNAWGGLKQALTGEQYDPATVQLLQKAGMSHSSAHMTNGLISMAGTMGGSAAMLKSAASLPSLYNSTYKGIANNFTYKSIGNAHLSDFNQHALKLSDMGKNNIRILRRWAKSKGWEKLPNPDGRPEMWGT
jgi:hypothetical protein